MKPVRSVQARILACLGSFSRAGTRSWLVESELRYGGYAAGIPRRSISEFDSRNLQRLNPHGMIGGDRMSPRYHNYGRLYVRYLAPFLDKGTSVTLIEVGILQGTGLAIWCDLFPKGRIVGFDIDLSHFNSNLGRLIDLGAFKARNHEVHTFDGFVDNTELLADILLANTADIAIDDASHTNDSILTTFESIRPFLAENFLYVIEDNKRVHGELARRYPQFRVDSFGALTMVTPIK